MLWELTHVGIMVKNPAHKPFKSDFNSSAGNFLGSLSQNGFHTNLAFVHDFRQMLINVQRCRWKVVCSLQSQTEFMLRFDARIDDKSRIML